MAAPGPTGEPKLWLTIAHALRTLISDHQSMIVGLVGCFRYYFVFGTQVGDSSIDIMNEIPGLGDQLCQDFLFE